MTERENFAKRAAQVFGALDQCIPSKHPDSNADGSSKQQQSKQVALENTVHATCGSPSMHPSQEGKVLKEKRACSEGSSASKAKRQKAWDSIHSDFRTHSKPQHRRLTRTPDFVRSPDKWAKYSLADDGTNDLKGLTADQVNKHAALQFLDEIKKRKRLEQSMSSSNVLQSSQPKPMEVSQKVVYSKPKTIFAIKKDPTDDGRHDEMPEKEGYREFCSKPKPFIKGGGAGAGVIRMPEYEV